MGEFREGTATVRKGDEALMGDAELGARYQVVADKMLAFKQAGYNPHYWQILAHTSRLRWRVLDAGRRGGKSLSAAWEAAWYSNYRALEAADGSTSTVAKEALREMGVRVPDGRRPIRGAIIAPDLKNYPTTKDAYFEALDALELRYEYNRNEDTVYLPSRKDAQVIVVIRGADKPRSARGAGYHWVWFDEPAFIPGPSYWNTLRPALSDTLGIGIFSTTPSDDADNWWFYEYFIETRPDPDGEFRNKLAKNVGYFHWKTLENPVIDEAEIEEQRSIMHPLIFAREYLARWDKGGGRQLKLDWIKFYDYEQLHKRPGTEEVDWSKYRLFAGIDPAISEDSKADYFCCWVIAFDPEVGRGYLVDFFRRRIDIVAQITYIKELRAKWPDLIAIGIESVAYQKALTQIVNMLGPTEVPAIPIPAKGDKYTRILSLGPRFASGQIRALKQHGEFMAEWEQFPESGADNHDDTLDGVDIAIRTAGTFMPSLISVYEPNQDSSAHLDRLHVENQDELYDEDMGWDY